MTHQEERKNQQKPGQGSTKVQLNPPSKLSLTIDDIILYPIDVSGPSKSNHLSFKPEVRNDIVIRFIGPDRFTIIFYMT